MGFREIEHLSDRAVLVTSTSLAGLFKDAVDGMYSVMDVECEGEACERKITVSGPDLETLLVGFLSECLNIAELDHLAVLTAVFDFHADQCSAGVVMAPIKRMHENIKAVTYSQMEIVQKDGVYETTVVFDL